MQSAENKYLTVIIPFLNEGEEIVMTVKSVRETAGDKVDIITINDCSTDGFPYRERLQSYSVVYLENGVRMGVAASRDYGINYCTTPYFLLLDGHMRFYDTAWSSRIIEELQNNDRQLLCCQGRYLEKVDGEVRGIVARNYKSYGAYLPLPKSFRLIDVMWRNEEARPESVTEPIPAVLGAGYAASKRYWQYLRGLDGLKYYGSDEPYISLKVWMEGGQCTLLKDVVAGHVYRKSSPFKRYTDEEIYNRLLVAELLLPQSFRAVMAASAQLQFPEVYEKATAQLEEKSGHIEELKSYYREIFNVSFHEFVEKQIVMCRRKLQSVLPEEENTCEVADFIERNPADSLGLAKGKMGQLLWLCLYAKVCPHDAHEETIVKLWSEVIEGIHDRRLPANFKYGLAGIGWALVYLKENGLVEDDISGEIEEIDKQVSCYRLDREDDFSLMTGAAGILAYILARIAYAEHYKVPASWIGSDKETLLAAAKRIEAESKELNALICAKRFLLYIQEGYDEQNMPVALSEWIDFHTEMPEGRCEWDNSLVGKTLSSSVHYLTTKIKLTTQ